MVPLTPFYAGNARNHRILAMPVHACSIAAIHVMLTLSLCLRLCLSSLLNLVVSRRSRISPSWYVYRPAMFVEFHLAKS